MEKKITVIIEKGKELFSAYVPEGIHSVFLNGQGKTVQEAISDMKEVLEECRHSFIDDGESVPEDISGELTFEYKYDIASLFDHFDVINVSRFARKIHMNESLLRKYKNRKAFASEKQTQRIKNGLHSLGQSLLDIHL